MNLGGETIDPNQVFGPGCPAEQQVPALEGWPRGLLAALLALSGPLLLRRRKALRAP